MADYGFGITMQVPFEKAVQLVKYALKQEGFGTLSEIDVARTLHEKTGQQIEPYTVLGVCNPNLALRAIGVEHEIGLMLPCTVLVHECGGGVNVSVQDPQMMVGFTGNERLKPIADEAKERMQMAIGSLEARIGS